MNQKLKVDDLIQIAIALLRGKEQIYSVLRNIDVEELEGGILGINQDIFNDSLKFMILSKLDVEDFDVRFSGDNIRVSVDKFVKAMMLEKTIRIKFKFHKLDLIFAGGQFFLTMDYLTEFEGIPPLIEKMPGGNAIKEMIVNTFIRHKIKDAAWIDIKNDKIYMDFSKLDAFEKLRHTGIFGVNVIDDIELSFLGTKNGELQLAYKTR